MNLLSDTTLGMLDPVMPVALAALGVLAGVNISDRRPDDWRLLGAAGAAAAVTAIVVAGGLGAVAVGMGPLLKPSWLVILAGGICAATSLALPSDEVLAPGRVTTRVIQLGVLLPIIAGGALLARLGAGSVAGAIGVIARDCVLTLAVAAAAGLLLTEAKSETEERVFAVSALLLVGGIAAALSVSALFGGAVAGVFWRFAARRPRETMSRDVLFVQHPLLVLVLLVAGAQADLTLISLALGAAYLALRVAGQLAAGLVARRVVGATAPRDLGLHLLPPGVFGVGFALNVVAVAGADASSLLATVVVGTIGSAIVAAAFPSRSLEA